MKPALAQAIDIIGSAATLARLLGVSRAAVSQWEDEDRRVPAKHCPKIEQLCGGRVRCEQLNDQIDWAYLRGTERDLAEAKEA